LVPGAAARELPLDVEEEEKFTERLEFRWLRVRG
jgi:hypothetical protein